MSRSKIKLNITELTSSSSSFSLRNWWRIDENKNKRKRNKENSDGTRRNSTKINENERKINVDDARLSEMWIVCDKSIFFSSKENYLFWIRFWFCHCSIISTTATLVYSLIVFLPIIKCAKLPFRRQIDVTTDRFNWNANMINSICCLNDLFCIIRSHELFANIESTFRINNLSAILFEDIELLSMHFSLLNWFNFWLLIEKN